MKKNQKNIPQSIITRDLNALMKPTGNIYESIVVISKRAKQIAVDIKEELTIKLMEFTPKDDNLEEIFENSEQIEISKYYEKTPKATQIAIDEFLKDEIYFRQKEEKKGDAID